MSKFEDSTLKYTRDITTFVQNLCQKNCSKTSQICMASLLTIYGDKELCKKLIEVGFMISVDVIKHNEAC